MSYNPNNPNGQAAMAASAPVVIASNQTSLPVILNDGTNIANVLKSDGTAAGQNSQLVAGSYLSVPFTTTVVANVGSTDAGNYRFVSVHLVTQGTSAGVNFQVSNDNINWAITSLSDIRFANSASNGMGTANTIFAGSLTARYFRLNVTGITAGTTAGVIVFGTVPSAVNDVNAGQRGTWTVGSNSATGSAVPANAFYMAGLSSSGNLTGARMGGNADGSFPDLFLGMQGILYNGATADRTRSNTSGAIIAAGATIAQTSTTQITYNASKLVVAVNISAFTSGTLTFIVNAVTASGYTYPMLTSTALAAVGTSVLRVFSGATPVANLTANDSIPRSFNVVVSGTFVATYGIDFNLGV